MFKNKVTLGSLAIIVIAVLVYFFSGNENKSTNNKFHAFISPESIKEILITKKDKDPLDLSSKDGKWFIKNKDNISIAATSNKLLGLFELINDSKVIQRISKKVEAYPDFKISNELATRIVLKKSDGSDSTIYLGDKKDYSSHFARKKGDPYVYLISKGFQEDFNPESWYYKTILSYDFSNLDRIEYKINKKKLVKILYEKSSDSLFIKEASKGKKSKKLDDIKTAFSKITTSKFVPKTKKGYSNLTSHSMFFKGGESIKLDFMKLRDKKENKHALYVSFKGDNVQDEKLKYIKNISDKYMFELSWFDKNKYQKKYEDFFEDIPKEEPKAESKVTK